MTAEQRRTMESAGLLLVLGIYLIGIALLTPHQGQLDGRSFVSVARASSWQNVGDWPAVWCSFKIILLNLGLFSIIASIMVLLLAIQRERLCGLLLFTTLAPSFGLLLGLFFLIKAVL
jgi:hypothetical protein